MQPLVWLRFIDDIFMIWTHGRDSLNTFIEHLNTCHPTIKFTSEISDQEISFLDTKVKKDSAGRLYTDLYQKDTDKQNYLLYSSAHTPACKKAIPYSQFLRIRRICTRTEDFDMHAKKMAQKFLNRGYPEKIITDAMTLARQKDRQMKWQPISA